MLFSILLATVLSSVVSLFGAFILSAKKKWESTFSLQLTAFAAGVMLTTALLHLLPEALHEAVVEDTVFVFVFIGIVLFFILERLVLWFHHHHEFHGPRPSALLITLGDTLHNFVDGVAIAAAFLVDNRLGVITAFAVAFHEIPQEIADFVTLIRSGVSAKRALKLNFFSALSSLVGAVVMYFLGEQVESLLPLIVAFSAGMFLYIALSDLIPELHHSTKDNQQKWVQIIWFFAGIIMTFFVTTLTEPVLHLSEDQYVEQEIHQENEAETVLQQNSLIR